MILKNKANLVLILCWWSNKNRARSKSKMMRGSVIWGGKGQCVSWGKRVGVEVVKEAFPLDAGD